MSLEHNLEHTSLYVKIEHFHSITIKVFNNFFYTDIKIYEDYNSVAVINNIKYDRQKCNIYEELEYGDSFKNFIDSALNIVLQMYPHIERFRISDYSNKTTLGFNNDKFTYIDVNMYYLLFYGEPWFSKIFGAQLLLDSDTQTHYTKFLENLNNSFDYFNYEDFKYYLLKYCDNEKVIEYINKYNIEELYNQNSNSLYNFFYRFKEAIGDNSKLREFLAPVFPYIMRDIFERPNIYVIFIGHWFISANDVTVCNVDYIIIDNIDTSMYHNLNTYKTIIQLRSYCCNLE